jgi:hypothetical protein
MRYKEGKAMKQEQDFATCDSISIITDETEQLIPNFFLHFCSIYTYTNPFL